MQPVRTVPFFNLYDDIQITQLGGRNINRVRGSEILSRADRPAIADATNEQWNKLLGVNLWGPIYLCRALVPHMRQTDRSDIVMISSIAAQALNPGISVYSVSKAFPAPRLRKTPGTRLQACDPLVHDAGVQTQQILKGNVLQLTRGGLLAPRHPARTAPTQPCPFTEHVLWNPCCYLNGKTCPNFVIHGNAFARLERYRDAVADVLVQRPGLLPAVNPQHHMPVVDEYHRLVTIVPRMRDRAPRDRKARGLPA